MSKKKKAKIQNEPWNKDKAVGQMAPFTIEQAALIRSLLTAEAKVRDLALFNTTLETMGKNDVGKISHQARSKES